MTNTNVEQLKIHRVNQTQFDANVIPANEMALIEIAPTTTELNQLSGVTSNIQTQLNNKATSAQGAKADTALQQADILNVVNSTATNKALSANMGKELQDQITHLKSIGRFLALWNCSTGLAQSNPTTSPYDYKTGDYFIVGTIAGEGGTNYKPDGTQYVIGTASTTEETEVVEKGYIYWFDSTNWNLMQAEAGTVTDVQVDGTSVVNNGVANISTVNMIVSYSDGSSSTFGILP